MKRVVEVNGLVEHDINEELWRVVRKDMGKYTWEEVGLCLFRDLDRGVSAETMSLVRETEQPIYEVYY